MIPMTTAQKLISIPSEFFDSISKGPSLVLQLTFISDKSLTRNWTA